ncbi:MAG: globin domain-containing protein, partial [Polymorphobacter sp.]
MIATGFRHAAAIETSLLLAGDRAGDLTPLVYARLFARHPEMAALFGHDRSGAVRGEMLAKAFDCIVDFLGEGVYAGTLVRSESATHDSYGVPPAVFGTFFVIVGDTIRDVLGADWTPDMALG